MKRKHLLPRILLSFVLLTACFAASAHIPLSDSETAPTGGSLSEEPKTPSNTILQNPSAPPPTEIHVPTPAPTEEPFEEYDITLMSLGDNLLHMGVVNAGKQKDGSYNYAFLFEKISEYLAMADIKVTNQETIFGGNELGFSGFPNFNSPTEIGDSIAAAGFNVVLHATNHAADQGLDGLQHCASFWEKYPDVIMTGIYKEVPESRISYLTIKDITFAILNYTYGPNLASLPSNLRGRLNMLCDYDRSTGAINFTALNPEVTEDIREADENADIVIVFPHWGTEYQTTPSSYQRKFAAEMTAAGADLIIGTHPHVPQPVEWVTAENGDKALCFYSLGNYVSTQKDFLCMLEGMAWVTFHVTETGVTIEENHTGILPLVNHYRNGSLKSEGVYPLDDYTEELALAHGIWNYGGIPFHLADLWAKSEEIFGDMMLHKTDILPPESGAD